MGNIIIILLCVPLYIVNSFCDKYVSTMNFGLSVKYNIHKFAIGAVFFLPFFFFDSYPRFSIGTILCGVFCGLMYAINKTVILTGYKRTSVAFMTLCHAAGMLLPCIVGHFLWKEKLNIVSLAGILFTVTAICLLKGNTKQSNKIVGLDILLGLIIFISSGGVMVVQKVMGLYFSAESKIAYNLYSFITPVILLSISDIVRKKHTVEEKSKSNIKTVLCAIGSAISLCIISLVMTKLAGKVPSIVLFPLFNGLGIISVTVGALFVFKEKLDCKKIIGLILGVIGMCIINI